MKGLAFLQPEVPHYRKEFFNKIENKLKVMDIYVYDSEKKMGRKGFQISNNNTKLIPNINIKDILLYSPFKLLHKEYDTLVLMLQFSHITTWFLLLTKFIHHKEIILWGQGISVKRYLTEELKPDWKLKWMIALADGVWLYTEKELAIWRRLFPDKKMISLNNTLTGVKEITTYISKKTKAELKEDYGIKEDVILIFCARFESNYRRTDLLVETIKRLNDTKFGFIIIGAGKNKPDFTLYRNVYDFGAVYSMEKKRDLFTIADIYYQPGWVGLSIVEAMAYGKPIFTFKRSEETKQCVEYCYIKPHENGLIFEDIDTCIKKIESISKYELDRMGNNARRFVQDMLMPDQMVSNALSIL